MATPAVPKFRLFLFQPNTHSKREANLTRILVLMVFCFLFCNLGKFILNMYDIAVGFERVRTCSKVSSIVSTKQYLL